MDEVEQAIKGQVDNWRFQRKAAYVTGMFKKGTKETDLYELPFDDELTESESYDIEQFYNNAKSSWN